MNKNFYERIRKGKEYLDKRTYNVSKMADTKVAIVFVLSIENTLLMYVHCFS